METGNISASTSGTSRRGEWESAIGVAGKNQKNAEANLNEAFSIADKGDISKLAKKLGAPEGTSLEGLQLMAKNAYERSSRAMAILSQVLDSMHQQMMRVINNIRG